MRNLRYAVRVLVKAPVFTATTVATLALCIGVNTAIYTVVDRVLLRPLPYPHPERLALVEPSYPGIAEQDTSQAGGTSGALRQGAPQLAVASFSNLGRGAHLVVSGQPECV